MVIVDSSVWIPYFRRDPSPVDDVVDALLVADRAALAGVAMFEVLRGSRSDAEFARLAQWMSELPVEEPAQETWLRASRLTYDLRTRGIMLDLADSIIAALALERDYEVYALDHDFERVPGLKLFDSKMNV